MSKRITEAELVGTRYGSLTILSEEIPSHLKGMRAFRCMCDCGTVTMVGFSSFRTGKTTSCGCFHRPIIGNASRTHGLSKTIEYRLFKKMISRCENPNDPKYPDYAGRGLGVWPEWRRNFRAFYDYMGPRPSPEHSLGRKNNNKGYEPGNVQWEIPLQQARNTRRNLYFTIDGQTKCLAEWVESRGRTPYHTVKTRVMKLGWSIEEALDTPSRQIRHKKGDLFRSPLPTSKRRPKPG